MKQAQRLNAVCLSNFGVILFHSAPLPFMTELILFLEKQFGLLNVLRREVCREEYQLKLKHSHAIRRVLGTIGMQNNYRYRHCFVGKHGTHIVHYRKCKLLEPLFLKSAYSAIPETFQKRSVLYNFLQAYMCHE